MGANIKYRDLKTADFRVEAIYEGGPHDNASDDPSSKLLKCENMGGFRISGSKKQIAINFVHYTPILIRKIHRKPGGSP
ncbi:hypothetical protein SAMN05428981_107105 [Bacillus sp. OV194]|nr:hypothetical protein SAMN05428981_107105 [Bacillus sp. OV194]